MEELLNSVLLLDCKALASRLPDKSVHLVIDDPPYNVPPLAVVEMPAYLAEMRQMLAESSRVCSGTAYVFCYPEIAALLLPLACRNVPGIGTVSADGAFENGRLLVWHYKNKNAMHHRVIWSRSYENILMLWNGKDAALTFNADAVREPYIYSFKQGSKRKGVPGRYGNQDSIRHYHDNGAFPRDVIECPALVGGKGKQEGGGNPTQKPEWLISQLIKASSNLGETVLDWHAGSFTTAACASKLGRRWIACDSNPDYCDIGRKRLASLLVPA